LSSSEATALKLLCVSAAVPFAIEFDASFMPGPRDSDPGCPIPVLLIKKLSKSSRKNSINVADVPNCDSAPPEFFAVLP